MNSEEPEHTKAFSQVLSVITAIPQETFGGDQPEYLYRVSLQQNVPGSVVEIGTNVGKSTIALAFAAKCGDKAPITSIDIFQHPNIVENLQQADVEAYVRRIISPSHMVAKSWTDPIGLLWIDGDHSFRGVYLDIRCWAKKVVPGGIVALHDYPGHHHSRAVHRAIQKSILGDPSQFKVIGDREVGSIIVFERLPIEDSSNETGRGRLYWFARDMRASIVRLCPRLASSIVRRIKER